VYFTIIMVVSSVTFTSWCFASHGLAYFALYNSIKVWWTVKIVV